MSDWTHLDAAGAARMVDVGEKAATARQAIAEGRVVMEPETLRRIQAQEIAKGDVLATARLAGIMAAKDTSRLIPLCHAVNLTSVEVMLTPASATELLIRATVKACERTGVEMEALTAVTVAALTIYDMAKALDRGMRIEGVRLVSKTGGSRGDYQAVDTRP